MCPISGADIRDADFTGASLRGARLAGTVRNAETNFSGVDLSDVLYEGRLDTEVMQVGVRRKSMSDRAEGLRWWVSLGFALFFAVVGGCGGGFAVGLVAEGVLGRPDNASGWCAIAGAVLLLLFTIRAMLRPQRRRDAERPATRH